MNAYRVMEKYTRKPLFLYSYFGASNKRICSPLFTICPIVRHSHSQQGTPLPMGSSDVTLKLKMPENETLHARTRIRRTFVGNYAILIMPMVTFGLGWWQWERHKWKTALIQKMHIAVKKPPVEFPVDNLSALDDMEFQKVRIRGVYLYDRQFVIRWRSRVDPGYKGRHDPTNDGAYIVTPMRLDGTNLTIMVNRGWLPPEKIEPELEMGKRTLVSGPKDLNALVRKAEKGSPFVRNDPEKGVWGFKDLTKMGQHCGAEPILVDADFDSSDVDGPIGGQTNIVLKNQHYSYMVQWFALTIAFVSMWAMQFL